MTTGGSRHELAESDHVGMSYGIPSLSSHYRASGTSEPLVKADSVPRNWNEQRTAQAYTALEMVVSQLPARFSMLPRAWHSRDRRHLALWDAVEWSVREDGTDLQCRPLAVEGEFFTPTADLKSPIAAMLWPLAFGGLLSRACKESGLNTAVLPGPTGNWLRSCLRKTFRSYVDWNALRRQSLAWLALDPLTLALHRRIFPNRSASIESFNWVHRHLRELSLVVVERPKLLPFLSLVHRERGRPVEEFNRLMDEAGITPAGRRWLDRVPFEAFDQASEFGTLREWPAVLALFANRLERLQIDEPSSIFTACAASLGPEYPDWFLLAMNREMDRLIDEEDLEPPDALPLNYEEAVRWVQNQRPDPDANQRRAGWRWIEAQANAAWLRELLEEPKPWPCPYGPFTHSGLEVVPLKSIAELAEESAAMRNCLKNYAEDCARGWMQPFSIRTADSGKRIGCFMLKRRWRSPWEVMEVAGPMNAPATEVMTTLAAIACERCNEQDARKAPSDQDSSSPRGRGAC